MSWRPALAQKFLLEHDNVAAVAGRLRERYPEASIWNKLIDARWSRPSGDVKAIGGTALLRVKAINEVGGYREDFIAGEEPEIHQLH